MEPETIIYTDKPVQSGNIVAAFATWPGGKTCLYLLSVDGREALDHFISDYSSQNMHTFDDEFDASITYNQH